MLTRYLFHFIAEESPKVKRMEIRWANLSWGKEARNREGGREEETAKGTVLRQQEM